MPTSALGNAYSPDEIIRIWGKRNPLPILYIKTSDFPTNNGKKWILPYVVNTNFQSICIQYLGFQTKNVNCGRDVPIYLGAPEYICYDNLPPYWDNRMLILLSQKQNAIFILG